MLPGTSGPVHRDPRGEKAATSGGKEGRREGGEKNANKMKGKKNKNSSNQQACASYG